MSSNKISHLNNAYTRNKKIRSAGLMKARKKTRNYHNFILSNCFYFVYSANYSH